MNRNSLLLSIALLVVFMTACTNLGESHESSQNEDNDSSESIKVYDIYGEHVLKKPVKRVVALEWVFAEDLLALDVQPVGVADTDGFNKWVSIDAKLSDKVVDVGLRTEPSLEAIANLKPDLILIQGNRSGNIYNELKSIAPTLVYDPYLKEGEGIDQYEEMEKTFLEIATAVGKNEKGQSVLNDLNNKYQQATKNIQDLKLDTNDITVAQYFANNQTPVFRLFNPNALAVEILEKIGLKNTYDSGNFDPIGFATVGVEEFTKVQKSNFLYIGDKENDNIFDKYLKKNAVWNKLEFVKEERVYNLGGDTWPFGGPLSAMTLVNQALESLSKNQK